MNQPAKASEGLTESKDERRARQLGRVVQALGLAVLLSVALGKLLMSTGTAVVFRYQGF